METRKHNNHHFHENLILRDGELFNRRIGIGFYSPFLKTRYQNLLPPEQEPRIIWLPGETQRIAELLDSKKSILIVGGLGEGKSALIYGLRARDREKQLPYCYIDGHYATTQEALINSSLQWAEKNGATVYWDSLDYLVAGPKKHRKLPKKRHVERTSFLLRLLNEHISNGRIQLVATSHDKSWLDKYGDPLLMDNVWRELTGNMIFHKVGGLFEAPAEIFQFYSCAGFLPDEISYLINLTNKGVLSDEVVAALQQYRIAKLIAFDRSNLGVSLRDSLRKLVAGQASEESFISNLISFIIEMNRQTKKLNGNTR